MIHSPLLVVGCPRSGTSLLFNLLAEAPGLHSIGAEGGHLIERWHHPRTRRWESGGLTADDLTPASRRAIHRAFELRAAPGAYWRRVNRLRRAIGRSGLYGALRGSGGAGIGSRIASRIPQAGLALFRSMASVLAAARALRGSQPIRLLEKTPENSLRLPFLAALFPDARFVFLVRDGRANVSSLMEGWQHRHLFHHYRPPATLTIDGNGRPGTWAFTLIPGWRELTNAPLEVVCAHQWIRCNQALQEFERTRARDIPIMKVRYEDLVMHPGETLREIASFADLELETTFGRYEADLPPVNVLTAPGHQKWRRRNPQAIDRILPLIAAQMESLGYAIE